MPVDKPCTPENALERLHLASKFGSDGHGGDSGVLFQDAPVCGSSQIVLDNSALFTKRGLETQPFGSAPRFQAELLKWPSTQT